MKINIIITILLCVIIQSCKTQKFNPNEIEGRFIYKAIIDPLLSSTYVIIVELKKDSSFKITRTEAVSAGRYYGEWKYEKNNKISLKCEQLTFGELHIPTPNFRIVVLDKDRIKLWVDNNRKPFILHRTKN